MRFGGEHVEKVTLKQRSETTNSVGETIESWDSNDVTIYAEFLDRHGKEGETDGQVMVIQDVRCKVRYRSGLDPTIDSNKPERDYRIQRGTVMYDVQSVIPIGRREGHFLLLQRRDNSG